MMELVHARCVFSFVVGGWSFRMFLIDGGSSGFCGILHVR